MQHRKKNKKTEFPPFPSLNYVYKIMPEKSERKNVIAKNDYENLLQFYLECFPSFFHENHNSPDEKLCTFPLSHLYLFPDAYTHNSLLFLSAVVFIFRFFTTIKTQKKESNYFSEKHTQKKDLMFVGVRKLCEKFQSFKS